MTDSDCEMSTTDCKERLTRFYMKYRPEKVEEVPSLLQRFAGEEEMMFEMLIRKYGPEPPLTVVPGVVASGGEAGSVIGDEGGGSSNSSTLHYGPPVTEDASAGGGGSSKITYDGSSFHV